MMNSARCLIIPNTEYKLFCGDVIRLAEIASTLWVVHHGHYSFNDEESEGWYLVSIPQQNVLPIDINDIPEYHIVSSHFLERDIPFDGDFKVVEPEVHPCPPRPCPPRPPAPQPYPPAPIYPPNWDKATPAFYSQFSRKVLDSTFISVPTLKHRDRLDTYDLPDGRICRVNNVDGEPKYYIWSIQTKTWEDYEFDIDVKDQVEEVLSTKHVVAGKGLAGGGALNEDVVITHDATGTGQPQTYSGTSTEVISGIHVDEFGHVTDADVVDAILVWDVIDTTE